MKNLLFILGLTVLLSACVPSLHALYDREENCVLEPRLAGEWRNQDGSTWTFTQSGEKVYRVVFTDKDEKTGAFAGHLVKVGDSLFLDLYPESPELPDNDFYKMHLLPVHTFLLVRAIEPELKMSSLDIDKLKKLLTEKPEALRHETREDSGIVLTASSQELQTFLASYGKEKGSFADPMVLSPVSWWVE